MASCSGAQMGTCHRMMATPAKVASSMGMRSSTSGCTRPSIMALPTVKCSRFSTRNSTTAAGSAASPKANNASGRPMLPELLNIIGGTKVLICQPARRASGQASRPEPSTISAAASASA